MEIEIDGGASKHRVQRRRNKKANVYDIARKPKRINIIKPVISNSSNDELEVIPKPTEMDSGYVEKESIIDEFDNSPIDIEVVPVDFDNDEISASDGGVKAGESISSDNYAGRNGSEPINVDEVHTDHDITLADYMKEIR